ncbi:tail fiber domain-containing protein [Luteibacter sp. NPDC031894]|uniref:tail fiber domain-containing protein n=1 Tax=Luteibacter sp. NPDC031894 TaxID=3390572 RepID=UPI003D00A7C0
MPAAITFKITDEGRAALRNSDGNGTNAVLVATVGITATAFTSGNPLPNEIKRLSTIKGGATAADTIHVTVSDDSPGAVYDVRGYGLYLQDGTLLGSYGQPDIIVQKSAQATMLLSADIQFADIDATQITFGDTNFSNPSATTERMGVVELATDTEASSGTDPSRAVTPKALLAALNARLGTGAPSDFVKTLLTKATTLAFVTALGIRSAAQYDIGAGNGLDADKLDGKEGSFYQAWANLTGVPTSFPPADHKHSASDITSGTLPVPRGGTGAATLAPGGFLVGNGTDPITALAPADALSAIGAAAKKHSHEQADIIGLAEAFAAKANKSDLDGKLDKTGGKLTGALSIAPPAGTGARLNLVAAGPADNSVLGFVKGDKGRWSIFGSLNQENGENTGSDLCVQSSDDAGNFLSTALTIARADSTAIFAYQVKIGTYLTSTGDALVLANNGANNANSAIYLRPRGTSSTAGQVSLNTVGLMTIPAGGTYQVMQAANVSSFRAGLADGNNGNGIGGAFTTWSTTRSPALQVDCGNDASAYMIFRATHWGSKHLAALDVYANGGNAQLAWHVGQQQTHAMYQDGQLVCNGLITGLGGFNASDRRMKKNIKRRKIQAGISRLVRRIYSSWNWKHNGDFDTGVIAQLLLKFAPQHVRDFPTNKRKKNGDPVMRLSVDKAGLALECALDADQRIDELTTQNAALLRRIVKLERKHK